MKRLGFIIAVYLLTLAAFPCCLVDDCPDDQPAAAQSGRHRNNDSDCGGCSPFFNCGGCTNLPVIIEHHDIDIVQRPATVAYPVMITPSIQTFHREYWQPPRLG